MNDYYPTEAAYADSVDGAWIEAPEAAERAGVSLTTIYTQIDKGVLSWGVTDDGVTVVDREDIEYRMKNGAMRDFHAPEAYELV
ncbi:hypothetical protein [Corynebacterium variabile]|uniref:hypothetical protein n=1 Tax=Corynebacterium variabile TaxID=1727 RepID=UPI003BAF2829